MISRDAGMRHSSTCLSGKPRLLLASARRVKAAALASAVCPVLSCSPLGYPWLRSRTLWVVGQLPGEGGADFDACSSALRGLPCFGRRQRVLELPFGLRGAQLPGSLLGGSSAPLKQPTRRGSGNPFSHPSHPSASSR